MGESQNSEIRRLTNTNELYGSGGCVNRAASLVQDGANGAVRISCEQWTFRPNSKRFTDAVGESTRSTEIARPSNSNSGFNVFEILNRNIRDANRALRDARDSQNEN